MAADAVMEADQARYDQVAIAILDLSRRSSAAGGLYRRKSRNLAHFNADRNSRGNGNVASNNEFPPQIHRFPVWECSAPPAAKASDDCVE